MDTHSANDSRSQDFSPGSASPGAGQSIDPSTLQALLGTHRWPVVLDVRRAAAYLDAPTQLPASQRVAPEDVAAFAAQLPRGQSVVCYCVHGHEVSRDAVAVLRAKGVDAVRLDGGIDAWASSGAPLVAKKVPISIPPGGGSHWVTRARPKIDRIACPWLVRRFIDPSARFSYVPTGEVLPFAHENGAVAFDIAGGAISHDGELCSFDVLLRTFGLHDAALLGLASIVRGADTDRLELAPQSAGLLAVSLGLSHNFASDHAMLEQGMVVYDALYAWCRFGQNESHTWQSGASA